MLFAIVGSGANVSADVDLRQRNLLGISVPTINSGDLAIQANVDTTSATFMRMLDVRGQQGSGDLRFPTAAGSRFVAYPLNVTPPFIRLETVMPTGSLQTDNRTFVLFTQPRGEN